MNWELMRPQDIEIRPAMTKNGKATLLLFQDSRNTMNALDRNFGTFGWSITYKDVGGQIYGSLSIKNPETGEWISKEDTGDESNISAQKGQSSDILKRCAVRFGYGRELYSAPRIVIDDDGYGNTGYKVLEIDYDGNRNIKHLVIVNRFGKEAFRWDNGVHYEASMDLEPKGPSLPNSEILKAFCSQEKVKEGVDKESLKRFYLYYEPKMDDWRGRMQPSELWKRWNTPKAA